jgi:hypothetical protein
LGCEWRAPGKAKQAEAEDAEDEADDAGYDVHWKDEGKNFRSGIVDDNANNEKRYGFAVARQVSWFLAAQGSRQKSNRDENVQGGKKIHRTFGLRARVNGTIKLGSTLELTPTKITAMWPDKIRRCRWFGVGRMPGQRQSCL